jgi:tyrosine decarboxylase/aspartate 1-decarboxylase
MENAGQSPRRIKRELKRLLQNDHSYAGGSIMGSMCTSPHPLARKIFSRYIHKNVGDPGLFPATAELEGKTVAMLGRLLSNEAAAGFILTGGSEANIAALWTAKLLHKDKGNEVLVPESAHFSFDKAASLLELKLNKVPLTDDFTVDAGELEKRITPRTIAIVGIAGTTPLGVVDPIPELSRIAVKQGLYLHVDAALGGFILPFLPALGRKAPEFDFSLPGVSSITIDPHKMGMSVIPGGGIIYRSAELAAVVHVFVPYLAGGETAQATVVGTRSGASVLAAWAMLKHLGRGGYTEVVKRCMENTDYLAQGIKETDGLYLPCKPVLNVVGVASRKLPAQALAARLRARGWALSLFPEHIRVVLMPHVRRSHIRRFLADCRGALHELL